MHPQRESTEDGSSPAERAAALTGRPADEASDGDDMLARPRSRRAVRLAGVAVVAVLLAGGGLAAWHWVRQQYFVGVYDDQVAVFRGLPQDLGPIGLSSLDHTTDVMVSALPPADRDSVRAGLVVDSSAKAAEKVEALRQAAACASLPTSTPTAAPTPTPAPTSSPAPGLAAGPTVTAGPTTGATTGPSPGPGLSAGGGSATGTATLTPSATSVSGGDLAAACTGSQ